MAQIYDGNHTNLGDNNLIMLNKHDLALARSSFVFFINERQGVLAVNTVKSQSKANTPPIILESVIWSDLVFFVKWPIPRSD